ALDPSARLSRVPKVRCAWRSPLQVACAGMPDALFLGMRTVTLLSALLILGATACVSTGKYDAAVADAAQARDALGNAEQASKAEKVRLEQEVQAAHDEVSACQRALDDATAVNQELRAELLKSGKDADQL